MLSKDRVSLKRNSSKVYISIVIVMVLGFGFFITSGFIFEEKIPVMASPINEEIEISTSQNLKIYEWIYDKDKNEMQIILETNNFKRDYDSINFEAFQRSDGEQVSIENIYTMDDVHVLKVTDFDPEYIQIAIDVIGENQTNDVEESGDVDNQYEEIESQNDENQPDVEIVDTIFTDYREVNNDEIILEKDTDYTNYISEIIIADTEQEIEKTNTLIEAKNQEIEDNKSRIQELTDEKVYQTQDEKVTTDSNINGLETENQTIEDEIGTLEFSITELEDKIQKTKQKQREELLN
ncbi:hypothetical protein [Oceanobacillus timonensis]|uniref:hypothetical protein n=1 Tax=Oceanobacillus timonensis TaxID=1926285 RepID=UPI0009BC2236|nr:hypothetical protein [Oceanobacillus timonensis]